MSDFWDYLKDFDPMWEGVGSRIYDYFYDNSHGGDRYVLSKLPFFSWHRNFRDAIQKAEDSYRNTGKDPQYIDRLRGPGFESLYGGGAVGGPVARMARSLSAVYTPEVIEDVGKAFNNMYW